LQLDGRSIVPFIVDGASPALLPATRAHLRALGDAGALPAYPRVLTGTLGYARVFTVSISMQIYI
jgi:hypothetical protein